MNTLKTTILDTLKKNDIKMIPKWKFILFSSLAITGLVFMFLVIVFLASLILFLLSRYGFMYMPFFGLVHIVHTLRAIPTVLFLCTVVLLVLIEVITRYYSFSFRRPLAVTLLGFTFFALLASFALSQSGIHEYIREYAKNHHINMMSRAYDRPIPFKQIPGVDIIRGVVTESSSSLMVIRLFDGTLVTAYATTTGDKPHFPEEGNDVIVLGRFVDGKFEIEGVREAPPFPFGNTTGNTHDKRMVNGTIHNGLISSTTMMRMMK